MTEVAELVFAGAVLVVFGSVVAAALGRLSRTALLVLAGILGTVAALAWAACALDPGRERALAGAGLTLCAVLEFGAAWLHRLVARGRDVERHFAVAEERLRTLVEQESAARAAELERTLSRARADSLSLLVGEERRIAEERRTALAERERIASAELSDALGRAEQRVAQRLADWTSDLARAEQSLQAKLATLEQGLRGLLAEAETRLTLDTERLDSTTQEQRARLAELRAEFDGAARQLAENAHAQIEAHESDRRRALHEVAERLRQRERDLRERLDTEENEATQRIRAGFKDVERRQLDQLKRVVERTAASFSEAVGRQFDAAIKSAREEAARRLTRELDRAVEHFAREAQNVLAERLAHVADAGGQRLERRLSEIGASLEEERDELVAELQRRIGETEGELRRQIQALGADAEAERTVLNARLQELQRRIEQTVAEAETRLAPTFRDG
ncbi:MAG TPA: hypothetical protein VE753_11000 [Gaiellaceae bacterium]|nr:hypothetical protein [Gaiellaceae bacterium]